jgi:hypothetical protein
MRPKCCDGLELEPAPHGIVGSAGKCIKSHPGVNNSRTLSKHSTDYLKPVKGKKKKHKNKAIGL